MKGMKNDKAVNNDGISSEVYKFASQRHIVKLFIFWYRWQEVMVL